MKYTYISGTAEDASLAKNIGDEIVIDGVKHVIDEINTYHETWDGLDIHRINYKVIKKEKTAEETVQDIRKSAGLD